MRFLWEIYQIWKLENYFTMTELRKMISDIDWDSMNLEIIKYKSLKLDVFWFLVDDLREGRLSENEFIKYCKKLYKISKEELDRIIEKYQN